MHASYAAAGHQSTDAANLNDKNGLISSNVLFLELPNLRMQELHITLVILLKKLKIEVKSRGRLNWRILSNSCLFQHYVFFWYTILFIKFSHVDQLQQPLELCLLFFLMHSFFNFIVFDYKLPPFFIKGLVVFGNEIAHFHIVLFFSEIIFARMLVQKLLQVLIQSLFLDLNPGRISPVSFSNVDI